MNIITRLFSSNSLLSTRSLWLISTVVAVAIGMYLRLTGLDKWSFASDEFYLSRSVDNILKTGLPCFECGGYYTRGLLIQYIIAFERLLGIQPEMSVRMVSALSYVISLPAIYLLARKVATFEVATSVVLLISLSVWEIEFSRFGRMYMPFQAICIWYLLALYKSVNEDNKSARISMYILSAIGVFVWEGGIFLVLLNFIPARLNLLKIQWPQIIISMFIAILALLFLTTNFRLIAEMPHLPTDVIFPHKETAQAKFFILATIAFNNYLWATLTSIIFLISGYCIVTILRSQKDKVIKLLFSLIILCTTFNQFGLATFLTLLAILYNKENFSILLGRYRVLLISVVLINLIFWIIFCFQTQALHTLFPSMTNADFIRKLLVVLIKFPNVFDSFLFEWLKVLPVHILIIISGITICFITTIKHHQKESSHGTRLLLFVLLVLIICIGFISTTYTSTRYSFFLYPLMLLLALIGIYKLTRIITSNTSFTAPAYTIIVIIFMIISNDWEIAHLKGIDHYKQNFRVGYKSSIATHYYYRTDAKGAAGYVNKHIGDNNLVISTNLVTSAYLKQLDYIYRSYQQGEFASVSCKEGRTERWTNKKLIYKLPDLLSIINNNKHISWLILEANSQQPGIQDIHNMYKKYLVYNTDDKAFNVYRIN